MRKRTITPVQSIPDAIKKLKKMDQSYQPFYEPTDKLWQVQMSQIFEFYISEVERCFALAIRKNLNSKYTYIVEISHLKRFTLEIITHDEERKTIFQDVSHIGIPITETDIKRGCRAWDNYACKGLVACLTQLKDYFEHIEIEGLEQVIHDEDIDDLPY